MSDEKVVNNEKEIENGAAPASANNGYEAIFARLNALMSQYADLKGSQMWNAFYNASVAMANNPQIQNARIKGIPALPVEYDKDQIGEFLRQPYSHETELEETAEILRWTNYPFYKIIKTYQDINTAKYYAHPVESADEWDESTFKREMRLIDRFNKRIKPTETVHELIGEALIAGKVAYYLRKSVDKPHNQVNYAFLQRLPQRWCKIIGGNNVSKYTVSFNMMYFMTPGATPAQFGDLFDRYFNDFAEMFEEANYSTRRSYLRQDEVLYKNRKLRFCPENLKANAAGDPRVFKQNGRWAYWISLPVEDIWVFEIDDTTPAMISPLAGLFLTYAQQSDFEQAQLSNVISPLIMFITAEVPYFENAGTKKDDDYRLSNAGRVYFTGEFDEMLAQNNTSGVGFFPGPFKNFKTHTYPEAANANEIAQKYSIYSVGKSGLGALLPTDDDIKAAQVDSSQKLESAYAGAIYRQFERMMNHVYESLNLKIEWRFVMFGSVYTDEATRDKARKALELGDTSAMYILSALDGQSLNDKLSMLKGVESIGIMDKLRIPETAYTQSRKTSSGTGEPGRPTSEGITSEGKEKAIDAGYTEA